MPAIEIMMNRGLVALVSPEDVEVINRHRWSANNKSRKAYAIRQVHRCMCPETGKQRFTTIYMHRVIIGAQPGQIVDHINGNSLDNRRENLRIATASQNAANKHPTRPAASGFRGVYSATKGWRAEVRVENRVIRCGTYTTPIAAAMAYDFAARQHFGEFAVLNFPDKLIVEADFQSFRKASKPCRHGSATGRAILTPQDVLAIRSDTRTPAEIAVHFGITRDTVYSVRNRHRWRHI